MMKKITLALLVGLALTACDPTPEQQQYARSTSLQQTSFKECVAAVPAGPQTTTFNDWAEVVSHCRDYARNVAIVCMVPSGCTVPVTRVYLPVTE